MARIYTYRIEEIPESGRGGVTQLCRLEATSQEEAIRHFIERDRGRFGIPKERLRAVNEGAPGPEALRRRFR